jgi:hypothetical protein
MVSGDVVFRVMYVVALIGAVPASIIGFLVGWGTLAWMITNIGETTTLAILAVGVAIFVFIIGFLIFRYPVPGGSALALQIGLLSSIVILTISLTYIYVALPVYTSTLYTIFTLAFLDVFLLFVAMLVALFLYVERL